MTRCAEPVTRELVGPGCLSLRPAAVLAVRPRGEVGPRKGLRLRVVVGALGGSLRTNKTDQQALWTVQGLRSVAGLTCVARGFSRTLAGITTAWARGLPRAPLDAGRPPPGLPPPAVGQVPSRGASACPGVRWGSRSPTHDIGSRGASSGLRGCGTGVPALALPPPASRGRGPRSRAKEAAGVPGVHTEAAYLKPLLAAAPETPGLPGG